VWAFTRTHLDVQLLVVANLSDREVEADVPDTGWADAELLLGNLPGGRGGLRLRPWESRVLRRTR